MIFTIWFLNRMIQMFIWLSRCWILKNKFSIGKKLMKARSTARFCTMMIRMMQAIIYWGAFKNSMHPEKILANGKYTVGAAIFLRTVFPHLEVQQKLLFICGIPVPAVPRRGGLLRRSRAGRGTDCPQRSRAPGCRASPRNRNR